MIFHRQIETVLGGVEVRESGRIIELTLNNGDGEESLELELAECRAVIKALQDACLAAEG